MRDIPHGIWPILYAFFTERDTLQRAAMRRQAEICVAAGAHGMAVLGLSPAGLATLARNHANLEVRKGEAPATLIARCVEETGGKLAVFNGRGVLELTDNLRAGCAGLIPAPDCFEAQVAIYEAMRSG